MKTLPEPAAAWQPALRDLLQRADALAYAIGELLRDDPEVTELVLMLDETLRAMAALVTGGDGGVARRKGV